jgi:hypothetical protein
VSTRADQQPSEPELHELIRRVVRFVCLLASLVSAFFAAFGVLITLQILNDEVPAGRIVGFAGETKMGTRVRLDSGRQVVFSRLALFRSSEPVRLRVGDLVEKRPDTCVYLVNETRLTDRRWVVREFLLPFGVWAPLGVYLLAGSAFVLGYGRTPLGDAVWPEADAKRQRRPRAGLLAMLLVNWLLAFVAITFAFGCMQGCLASVGKGDGEVTTGRRAEPRTVVKGPDSHEQLNTDH